MKRILVGKAIDGLVHNPTNKKPRHYAVIDGRFNEIAVSKIQAHERSNEKHVIRLKNGLRKPIERFGQKSILDKTLFIHKKDGTTITHRDLDYINSNFEFTNS